MKHNREQSPHPSEEAYHKRKKHQKRHRSQSSSEDESHHSRHTRPDKEKRPKHKHDDKRGQNSPAHRRNHSSRHQEVEFDPNMRIKQEKDDDNIKRQNQERRKFDGRRRDKRREREQTGDFGLNTETHVKTEPGKENEQQERQKPSFELSGKLTEDTNTFRGVVIKYNEPPEAMKPKRRWRLYPFKDDEALPVLHIHRQSAFLMGRDRRVADIPVDHPSCSKQQAVLQFRAVKYTRPDGSSGLRVRPYIIDLESANGTYLNGDRIEPRRYYELKEKDVLKFGFSSREYVVLHDNVDLSEVREGHDIEEV